MMRRPPHTRRQTKASIAMPAANDDPPSAQAHRRQGEAAEAATRWSDAIREYEGALSIVAAGGAPDLDEAALLTSLGRCYWNLADARTAWRTLRRAITLYQQRNDGVGQANATVEILRIWAPPDRQRQMAEDAMTALGDADPYLRAKLLLRLRWFDEDVDAKFHEAIHIGEQHGFDDIVAFRIEREGWLAFDEGRIEEAIVMFERAHDAYAKAGAHDVASGVLRNCSFNTIESGMLDRGYQMSRRAYDYASSINLAFNAQLALMDMAGVLFARGEFDACDQLITGTAGISDFRADLYRMWMAEARGDLDTALSLMVSPDRGGSATTAVGQIHASSAGVLFRAGRTDAAQSALDAWVRVDRREDEHMLSEAPAMRECLLAFADRPMLQRLHAAFARFDERFKSGLRFTTLQGRALAPVRAGIAARLGHRDEAARIYREGLAWCEEQRCVADAALCRAGLAALNESR